VNVLLLLALADAQSVAVRPSDSPGCPAPTEVSAALAARVPGALVPFDQARQRQALVLDIVPEGEEPASITLVDAGGKVKLERSLRGGLEAPAAEPLGAPTAPAPLDLEGRRDKECAALAETAALIVERYLSDLQDHLPPPPPPAPPPPPSRRWELSLATAFRPGSDGLSAFEIGPHLGWFFARGHLLLSLSLAAGGESNPVPSGSRYQGQARQRRFPVDVGLWWASGPAGVELQVGAGAGLDLTRVEASGDPGTEDVRLLPGPALWTAAGVRLPLGRKLFFRIRSGLVASLIQYDFSYLDGPRENPVTVFSAPTRRIYARISADVGLALP
jgi:hypothetical protein